jgi:ubiquinone/menaquinone biosynthesis C-methylase UbiE
MGWFRAAAPGDPLVVAMTGVKLGDRLLVIGGSDAKTVAHLALKPGISGRACVVDEDGGTATRAGDFATREGALIEAETAPLTMLPYDDHAFDVVALNHALSKVTEPRRSGVLAEARRVLRDGGRCIAIEAGARGGLGSLFGAACLPPADLERALTAAGFRAVRTLAARERLVFVEGARRAS